MKKLHSRLLAVVLPAAVVCALAPVTTAQAATGKTHRLIYADGVTGITDSSYNSLFSGGNAAAGVLALIQAGKVRVNDTQVPTPLSNGTYSTDRMEINGGSALWENADGTWSWTAHITLHGENQTYPVAAEALVNAISTERGLSYRLTFTNGVVTAINEFVYDAAFANTVRSDGNYTTITTLASGNGDGSTDKPNPQTLKFPNGNVEGNPQSQNIVKYWDDAKGWHLQRAISKNVVVVVDTALTGVPGTINGQPIIDSRISLQYSQPWNRPTQPVEAMIWLGDTQGSFVQWLGAPGITIGFTHGGTAKAALVAAIAKSTHALDTVAVSAAGDGSDIPAGQMWVTQTYHDTFARAIADAEAVLAKKHVSDDVYDGALVVLAQAYGGVGDHYSIDDNTYFTDGIGFWTFAQSHLGTGPSS